MSTITRNISFGLGDVKGIITPLIPLNCIYDYDVGVMRFMYETGYYKSCDCNQEFFELFMTNPKKAIASLYAREDENPLVGYVYYSKDALDLLYSALFKEHGTKILHASVRTGIYDLCVAMNNENSVKGSIIYKNSDEYEFLKNDRRLAHMELVDLEYIKNLDDYNCLYFKSLEDAYLSLFINKINSKSIYILDYRYNFNKDGDLISTNNHLQLKNNRNIINIINAYDKSRLGMEVS